MRPCTWWVALLIGQPLVDSAVALSPAAARRSWTCPCESWGCGARCPCACPCPCADQQLCGPLLAEPAGAPRREVLAFHAHLYNESARTGAQNFDLYPWEKLTTIAIYTGLGNDTTGTDSVLLTCTAHSHGVRVLLGTGGQWSVAPWTASNLKSEANRKALAKQYIDGAVLYGLDGLNLDVEYDGSIRNGSWYAERADLLALFTCEMRELAKTLSYVPDTFRLSFASPISPTVDKGRFAFLKMDACLDYWTPMAYHEPVAALQAGVQEYSSLGIKPEKLVVIFAWFGADVACTNSTGGCALKWPHCYAFGQDGHICQPGYSTIMHDLKPMSTDGLQWDNETDLPFLDYLNASLRHRVTFSNAESTALRAAFAHSAGTLGVGVWTADAVDSLDYPEDAAIMWTALTGSNNTAFKPAVAAAAAAAAPAPAAKDAVAAGVSTISHQSNGMKSDDNLLSKRSKQQRVGRCDITSFGAVDGNHTSDALKNSAAIRAALMECDRVVVPAGRTFKLAPVELPSNRILELEQGSALVGSDDWTHYGTTHFMPPMGNEMQLRPLLYAVNSSNITVEGGNGTIDGNGWFAWPATNWSSPECGLHGHCAPDPFFGVDTHRKLRAPHVLTFIRCTGIELRNVTVTNPAFWGIQHFYCNQTRSSHVTILAPRWTRQIAGFMPWSVVDYTVEDSYVHVGDDAVAIMSGNDEAGQLWPSSRLVFRRLFVRGRSVAVGSADSGNVTDVLFEDCTIGDDAGSSPWAFKIKMHVNMPSHVSGVVFNNCKFGNITKNTWQDPKCYPAIQMGMNYASVFVDPTKGQPQIWNISFINTSTTYTCTTVGSLVGATADSISGLHFEGCDFRTTAAKPWALTNVSTSTCTSENTTPAFPTDGLLST